MASRKRNLICVLFDEVPEGTHFREGAYSWVNKPEALEYIEEGYGKEYDPKAGNISVPTMDNTKKEIEQYLDANGIEYSEHVTKAELLELIDG